MLPTTHSLLGTLTPESREGLPVPWGILIQPHPSSVPRDLEKQQQDIPTARSGQGNWTRVCQAMVRERRVHFLLEPTLATAPSVVGTEVEGNRSPEGPIRLCSNGQPPTMLPTGAPRPGELEELEQRIADARSRLHQALVRHGELLAQLPGGNCDGPLCLL